MMDEARLGMMLEQTKNLLKTLDGVTNPTSEDVLQKIKVQERIFLLETILGDERKKEIKAKLREMKVSEWEVLRGSILVVEQILISRGFTHQEELQTSLLKAIEYMRKTKGL
jgi:hypothetical protein